MPLKYRPRYVPRVKVHRVRPKKRVTFARKVKAIVNRVVETKCFHEITAYADLEAGSQRIIHVSAVADGNYPEDRVGQIIEPTKFTARLSFKTTGVTDPVVVRVMLIRAKQCDGTAPTLADILPTSSGALGYLGYEMPLVDNLGAGSSYGLPQARRKFQVMYDKVLTLNYATGDSPNALRRLRINKTLSGKIFYTGANATDEGNNQLYLFIHTDAADDKIEEAHDFRLFFKDA